LKVLFTPGAAEDLAHWRAGDPAIARQIEDVLHELQHDTPLAIRLTTPLALHFPPLLSVKITSEHRLVYERLGRDIIVHQCRYHY
jgi:toxin YoeB